jgi:hypothetical protein
VIQWGGRNSPLARVSAAAAIVAEVERIGPDEPIFIIAHSHGGNGAMYAAYQLATDSRHNIKGIVCLATPFIAASARSIPQSDGDAASDVMTGLLWTPLLLYSYIKFLSFDVPILEDYRRASALMWRDNMILILLLFGVVRLVAGKLVVRLFAHLRRSAQSWAESLRTPTASPFPVLVIRSTSARSSSYDEAILALRISHSVVNALFSVWGLLANRKRPRCGCCAGTAILALVFMLTGAVTPIIGPGAAEQVIGGLLGSLFLRMVQALAALAVVGAAFVGLSVGLILLLSVIALLFAAYGLRSASWGRRGETLFAPLVVDVCADTHPVFPTDELLLPRLGLLRHWLSAHELVHSVYLDNAAVSGLATWIYERMTLMQSDCMLAD